MTKLTWEQVNAWRMKQHGLTRRANKSDMVGVVRRLGAVQAQLMSAAELQLWARVTDVSSEYVQASLWESRTLVKSWLLRGTLHLMAADDYPLYIAALTTLKHFRRGSWLKSHDLTSGELDAMLAAIPHVLTDTGISREALAEAISQEAKLPKLKDKLLSGWAALLKPASFSGDLCFGPSVGQNVTFVNPHIWLGEWESVEPNAALAEILRRYLTVYAPSTPDEFARWFGFEPSDAKRVFKSIEGELSAVDVGGWKATVLSATLADIQASASAGVVRLLPYFDIYTIAVAPHVEALMSPQHKALVYRPQGWISPVVVVDGRIVGVWEYETKKVKLTVKISLFEPLTPANKEVLDSEAQNLGWFFNLEPVIEYTTL